jgi:ribonuclease T1
MRHWRALLLVCGALALGLWLGLAPARSPAWGWIAQDSPGEITLAQLPREGRQTLALIEQGGPFPYAKDGAIFGNREGRLPRRPRGYYREYTVPTPAAHNRGARRIIAGQADEYWYTADHYHSFRRIRK